MQLFRTVVTVPSSTKKISFCNSIVLMGSCFSESIGQKLIENKFLVENNPFGIVYNPLSISHGLTQLLHNRVYNSNDIFFHHDQWNSFDHHSRFSNTDAEKCLMQINSRIETASNSLKSANFLFITFGSAYVYFHKSTGKVVSNCHKVPATEFIRKRISVEDIVSEYSLLIPQLQALNPQLQIVFTVSPVRHWADGAHENQLSKSTLLLAIDEICKNHANTAYFPSYEIMMDELRDYRFYNDDMIHPSTVAVDYIWEQFSQSFFNDEIRNALNEIKTIVQASKHRPFNPQSDSHRKFCNQMLQKIESLKSKYQILFEEEERFFK